MKALTFEAAEGYVFWKAVGREVVGACGVGGHGVGIWIVVLGFWGGMEGRRVDGEGVGDGEWNPRFQVTEAKKDPSKCPSTFHHTARNPEVKKSVDFFVAGFPCGLLTKKIHIFFHLLYFRAENCFFTSTTCFSPPASFQLQCAAAGEGAEGGCWEKCLRSAMGVLG